MRRNYVRIGKAFLTPEEYLQIERNAEFKSEYYAGQMFAMAGGSETHALMIANVVAALHGQMRGRPCRVYGSDLRVQVSASGLYTYPDVVVVCGERRFRDDRSDTLLNPTVILEVLSPSTERYDKLKKFAHYRGLESLQEYVLIAQDAARVEGYARQSGGGTWTLTETRDLDAEFALAAIGATLRLSDIYDNVTFALSPTLRQIGGEESR